MDLSRTNVLFSPDGSHKAIEWGHAAIWPKGSYVYTFKGWCYVTSNPPVKTRDVKPEEVPAELRTILLLQYL